MASRPETPLRLLEGKGAAPSPDALQDAEPRAARERGRQLACASCRRPITSDSARIEVDGKHAHTFANPLGYVFRIGCFGIAAGVTTVGPVSSEFAWFSGYSWQIEECASCGAHLGWVFRSAARGFHGLVLDSLIEIEDAH